MIEKQDDAACCHQTDWSDLHASMKQADHPKMGVSMSYAGVFILYGNASLGNCLPLETIKARGRSDNNISEQRELQSEKESRRTFFLSYAGTYTGRRAFPIPPFRVLKKPASRLYAGRPENQDTAELLQCKP